MESESGKPLTVLGLMSGTSLDGLDMALCTFVRKGQGYDYETIRAITIPYTDGWRMSLEQANKASAEAYLLLHHEYGKFLARHINQFIADAKKQIDLVSSHGHTIFHQPAQGFTSQIGCGATIAGLTGITTVCDFRSKDISLGGQGAPLVPIGDELLFSDYEACLNIGGIANISFKNKDEKRIAYDICEANMLLNYLSRLAGNAYDESGQMAANGKMLTRFYDQLHALPFYSQEGARSLGREWFEQEIVPLIDLSQSVDDLLHTATIHVGKIIASEIEKWGLKSVLVTGGGAFNRFLVSTIKEHCSADIILPAKDVINFKEALIFAFLGYLRLVETTNTMKTVTGALRDSIGGAVYLGG